MSIAAQWLTEAGNSLSWPKYKGSRIGSVEEKRLIHPKGGKLPAAKFEEVYRETYIFLTVKLFCYFPWNNKAQP